MKTRLVWHGLAIAIAVTLVVLRFVGPFSTKLSGGEFPRRPVEVVVPFAAGGGSDNFARMIQKAVAEENLLGQPLIIDNRGGGSGTIGSRVVKDSKPDGYRILCLHDAIMTSKLTGTVQYGPEAFEPIAQTGDIVMLVIVAQDSPFATLGDLMKKAKDSPGTVVFGTNIGSPAHFAARKLEQASPGASFNYVQSGGGQMRYTRMIGGHIEAGVFSLDEFVNYRKAGKIRALAVLTPERHPAIEEVPTATEQGVPAVASSAQYWWAPKGTPKDRVERIARMLKEAMESESAQERLREWWIDPVYRSGAELDAQLAVRMTELGEVRMSNARGLPDFPRYLMMIVGLLGIFVVVGICRGRGRGTDKLSRELEPRRRLRLAALCFLLLCGYVLVLHFSLVNFAIATVVLIVLAGGAMANWQPRPLVVIAETALIVGIGTELIFTRVFSVPLP